MLLIQPQSLQIKTSPATPCVPQMETVNAVMSEFRDEGPGNIEGSVAKVEGYSHRVDEVFTKVNEIEQRVNEVEHFFLTTTNKKLANIANGSSIKKDKDKQNNIPSIKKHRDKTRRDAAAAKRMQELMRQFGPVFRQITQHKWAWPFMHPVDVEGLGLHDYYEIIDRPMDFTTIKNQMEAKDGTGYKNVQEICADVRLVFTNAMNYNDEKSDVYVMAKTLSEKFEEKWRQLLPKVTEEEKKKEDEEAEAQLNMQVAWEAAQAKTARDLSNELCEVDVHLDTLRETLVQKCRKISTEEKRKIGIALSKLSPGDLSKALEIVAQNNPSFEATTEEVDLDIDAQSELTLWRLKFFVKEVLEIRGKKARVGGNHDSNAPPTTTATTPVANHNSKRKWEVSDSSAKNAKRSKSKKFPS